MAKKPVAAGKSSFDHIDKIKFFSLLDLGPNDILVDLACGIGRYSIEIARKIGQNGKVHAVDLWPEGIDILNNTIQEQNITNLTAQVADITRSLPLESSSFDKCLLSAVLHDLTQEGQVGVLNEAERLLKPGGILTVVEFRKVDEGPGPPMKLRFSEEELEQRVIPYGFSKSYCDELGPYTYLCQFKKEVWEIDYDTE